MNYLRESDTYGDSWPVERVGGLNMMTQAAIKNNFHMTQLIMAKYVSVAPAGAPSLCDLINAKDVYGNTSLHYYALRRNHDAIDKLVRDGGSLTQQNRRGQRPLDVLRTHCLDFQEHDGVSVTFTPHTTPPCKVVSV